MKANEISQEMTAAYQERGFIKIPGIITKDEAEHYRKTADAFLKRKGDDVRSSEDVFTQAVNVWREDETMKELTLHENVGQIAQKLAGLDLRIWHDHLLVKKPNNQAPTEFHQDQPYWPHENSVQPLSAWIALVDVPVEKGCMTFIPGSHLKTDLPPQSLRDAKSLFSICPELKWESRITEPLKAGDCTFHHGRCAHRANANETDDHRFAHVVIFMDNTTTFNGNAHCVTDGENFKAGDLLDGELFPEVLEKESLVRNA